MKAQIICLIILLFLSSFFSSAETALVSVNKIRLRALEEEGDKRASKVLKILDHESKMLSAILIGNNLVNTFMASLATTIAYTFGGAAVSIATCIITILILIFGEITPKTMATRKAEQMALQYASIISFIMVVFTPVIFMINSISHLLLKILGVDMNEENALVTETELRTLVDVSHEEGVIEADEKDMIHNVFDLEDAKAKEVMVPRVHVVMADTESTYEDLIEIFRKEKFTRLPIYEETIDNIVGLVNMKDLLFYDDFQNFKIKNVLRKPYFTYENKKISDLLMEMKASTINLAFVMDEYGEFAGIITLEDIIEEIIGEVQDEYDEHEDNNIQKINQYVYDVKGYLSLHDLNDALNLDLDSDDYDSIGGLIMGELGKIPSLYDHIVLDNDIELQVKKIEKNRIEEVRIILPRKNNTE